MDKSLEDFISNAMVKIPDGSELIRKFHDKKKWISSNYRMGIPSSGMNQSTTEELVKITSFYISKYPVTNQLYNHIMGIDDLQDQKAKQPKVNISWIDAIMFCNAMSLHFELEPCYTIDENQDEVSLVNDANGYRLPTDAEWQYACKAGSSAYQYSDIDAIGWHLGNSNNTIHDVGLKAPNAWGLFDMLGNVWEWTWDLYNPETYDNYRIFRGGSFAEEGRICGATTRRKSLPIFSIDDLGFRLVKNI